MLRHVLAALAALFFSVSAFAQALPSTTPPLSDIWHAANDAKYGRIGDSPDADFGRDRMYRGTTPANDATFTRRGRSGIPKAVAGAALAKFARKFGPLGTATALYELAQDLGAEWRVNSDGSHDLMKLRGDIQCRVQAGNGVFSGVHTTCQSAAEEVAQFYAQPADVNCPGPELCTINGYGLSQVIVTQGEQSWQSMSEADIAKDILSSPLLPRIGAEVDSSPEHQALPSSDPARLPWSPEVVILPEPITLAPRTTVNPDGSTTVTSRRLEPSSSATGPIFWTPVDTVTTTMPDGSVQTGTSEGGPQTSPEPAPFEMPCGVPGKLPCNVKVDETGVPNASSLDANKGKDAEQPLDDFLRNPSSIIPAFPTINWAFVLPTSCGVIPTPQFEPFFTSLDVCQFQPMFHDVMNVVWMLGGLFGAISLFMKSALAD